MILQVTIEMMPIESTKRESIGMFYINVISFTFGKTCVDFNGTFL